jgi:hypothetical protein
MRDAKTPERGFARCGVRGSGLRCATPKGTPAHPRSDLKKKDHPSSAAEAQEPEFVGVGNVTQPTFAARKEQKGLLHKAFQDGGNRDH